MNESRSLLKELYELRKLDEPLITGQETMEVLNGSFRMHKEQFNSLSQRINRRFKEVRRRAIKPKPV